MLVTKREIQYKRASCNFTYIIPEGAKVEDRRKTHGAYFVDPNIFEHSSFERHDATYYGIRVDPSDVIEVLV